MPQAFIYLTTSGYNSTLATSNNCEYYGCGVDIDTCFIQLSMPNEDDGGWSTYYLNDFTTYDSDTSMQSILDEDTNDEYKLIFNQYTDESGEFGTWYEFLFIPSNNKGIISVDSKETQEFYIYCQSTVGTIVGNETQYNYFRDQWIYVTVDSKEQLYKFDTLEDGLRSYYWSANVLDAGYKMKYSYEWMKIENKIDDSSSIDDEYGYFVTTIDYTFDVGSDNAEWIVVAPNEAGQKITYVTKPAIGFLDVLSLSGGLLTSVYSILTLIVIYLIWGFRVKTKLCKWVNFDGLAPNSGPTDLEMRKFTPLLKQYMFYIEEKFDARIKQLTKEKDDQIMQLKQEIENLKKTNEETNS